MNASISKELREDLIYFARKHYTPTKLYGTEESQIARASIKSAAAREYASKTNQIFGDALDVFASNLSYLASLAALYEGRK